MNLGRILASAVVRRLALLVVGGVLALLAAAFGISEAHAQSNDQGQAFAECSAAGAAQVASHAWMFKNAKCVPGPDPAAPTKYDCLVDQSFDGPEGPYHVNNAACGLFPFNGTCAGRASETTWTVPDGDMVCSQGCTYLARNDLTTGITFFSTLNAAGDDVLPVCGVTDYPEPLLDTDGDGEPDETDAFPNDPTETTDTDGDGIGDNADFSPDDPEDGKDTDGEEDGDDEGDNVASGGGTCAAAPSCKGDGIQCAQLWQQWKARCEGTAQGTVTGNVQDCSSVVTVTSPDAVANAQLLTLRSIACKDGGEDEGGGNVGDANNNGVADVLEGEGTVGEDPGEEDEVTRFGMGLNPSMLNEENIFGGGQCPSPPSFPIMGTTINPGSMPYFCQIMAIARVMILLFGAFSAVMILMGGRL